MKIELREKVASIFAEALEERFGDELVFNPIIVIPKVDDYGEDVFPYIHVYVVFDGDQAKLDPDWTLTLTRRIRPSLIEAGVEEFPVKSFVSKSEWKYMKPKLER